MRKTTVLLAALVLCISGSAAVVGHNSSGSGDMHIMGSGSSASASASTGPNGTNWRAELSMTGRHAAEDPVGNIGNVSVSDDKNKSRVSFSGEIVAGTPCHVIDHEVEVQNDTYIMDIRTVQENSSQACTQVLTAIQYDASFEAKRPYTLVVRHDGDKVKEFRKKMKSPRVEEPKPGFIRKIVDWISGLF